jgi:hypothetical protein
LNFFFFTLIASLSLFSFFLSVLTDPGHVPSSFYPDVESSSDAKDVSFSTFLLMGFFLFPLIFTMLLCFLLFGNFNFMFLLLHPN